ncbi:MBL fold metallo-hydrolase [Natronococcus sp. A-GB7]|uniref:ComEC/Rec2 family competence protein n=1 Tax=Natronococcus sp. A-GB7 TaxID=3037649 RepID=UPI00241F0026|nr:MBL fold metallo-hydrolase [Natronococcus sp. A-GB7]MDG5820708.1 MBL fold metallo-hydrolase [Natronococcus sp. A-GB7]
MLVTPLDADDEPPVDADAEDLEAADTDGQADDGGTQADETNDADGEVESDDGEADEPDSEPGSAGTDIDDGGSGAGDADDGSSDESGATSANGDSETERTTDVDGELEIHHIDVGQADSTLLVTPDGETVLIDTGDWRQDGSDVIAYLESQGVDRVDHLVATHAHADHIGGHAAVIEHFETDGDGIGAAYDSGVAHDSATYENYLDAIEAHDVDLFEVEEGDELPIDGLEATVLNPSADESGDDLHYNSVSVAFEFGKFTYLTTGDAEADAEQRMVEEHGGTLEADAYQAGHHGSSTSSNGPFMDAVDPEIAVISSAYDSQYGHPHEAVLEDYAERGIETYWTGVHGDVVVTTDGAAVSAETEREFSTDAADLREERPDEQARVATPQVDTATAGVSG